jgi:MFS superfamily sulfate permease-like transporter
MSAIHPLRAGLVLGAVIGLWHLVWSLLVAIGWAQPVIDFVFWMHFLKPAYMVQPFNAATAVILVAVTALVGFVIGVVFGAIWNWIAQFRSKA